MSKVTIEVFFSKTCPNCPPQKEAAKKFSDREEVKVKLTDVMAEKKRAQNHGVSAVPTTVIDGPGIKQKTGFRGVTPQEKLETAVEVAKGEKEVEALENPGILDAIRNFFLNSAGL